MKHLIEQFGLWFLLLPIGLYLYNRKRNKKLSQIINSDPSSEAKIYAGQVFGNPAYVPYLFLILPVVMYYFFVLIKNKDVQTALIISLILTPFCFFLALLNGKKYLIESDSLVINPFVGKSKKIAWKDITSVNLRVVSMRSGGTGWILDIFSTSNTKGLSTIKSDTKDSDKFLEFLKFKRPDLKINIDLT